MATRKPQSWDPLQHPRLLAVTGHRDTTTNVTYIPYADVALGVMGWEVIPPRGPGFLVYIIPTLEMGKYEIRVHSTMVDPDPVNDRVIGTVQIPDDLFG
jgi:hypothetical protein